MDETVLLWFKNDLRLHDNEALHKAVASGAKVLPVYCFDTTLYRHLELGFRKTDLVRFLFAGQCVSDLRESLRKHGGDLKIVVGNPREEIPNLVKATRCKRIFAEQEYATEEMDMVEAVKSELPDDCTLNLSWGKTLYHIDDIPYSIDKIPLTSKAYRINTTKKTEVRSAFEIPKQISFATQQEWGELPDPSDVGLDAESLDKLQPYVAGGESKALERLQEYSFGSEALTSYRWTRNRSLGMEYSSKFSPYMALGCLSPRTIYRTVKEYEKEIKKNQSTWWLIFEIVWRDYFTFKLMRFQNEVYRTGGIKGKETEFENPPELFEKWCRGATGIPFIDAHMRQLNTTGYMSNRGRVNCASFLIHDYKVDWTWGASYFESKLIDYDVSSNWLNWHYQAFESYYTNPVHQSLKYKAGDYIREYIKELSEVHHAYIHAPWLMPKKKLERLDYPHPVEIHKKWQRSINNIQKKAEPTLDL
ncbi:MAG: DASH family cryptochrome [Pricia sp.]